MVRLRTLDPSLTGAGVAIALVDPTAWVNPATSGQPAEKFFYVDGDTVTQTAPLAGWDLRTLSSAEADGCKIYQFALTAAPVAVGSRPRTSPSRA